LKQLSQTFIKIENVLVVIGIILTMLIVFVNVVTRYVFHVGVGWSEELVRYVMIWITFIGMGIAIRTKDHVAIDFFVNKLGRRNRKWVDFAGNLIACFFCLFLFISSLILTVHVFQDGQISAGLQIPMGFVYALLPISTAISTFRYFILVFTGQPVSENI
jgi:C4-dicarboxylate transporter DctQ subunit